MGRHVPLEEKWRPLLVWRPVGDRGRSTLEEGGDFPLSRLTDSWTPWNFKYHLGYRS